MRRSTIPVLVSAWLIAIASGAARAQWVPNGIPVGSTGQSQDQEVPFVCPDGQGGTFVAWGEHVLDSSTRFDGYLQHVLSNGQVDPRWPTRGFAYVVAPED